MNNHNYYMVRAATHGQSNCDDECEMLVKNMKLLMSAGASLILIHLGEQSLVVFT